MYPILELLHQLELGLVPVLHVIPEGDVLSESSRNHITLTMTETPYVKDYKKPEFKF